MNVVKVEVYGGINSGGGGCSCGCSGCTTGDVRAEFEAMKKSLQDIFGTELLTVEYIDTDSLGLSNYPEIEKVVQAGYPFPVTVVNGNPRWAGGMPVDSMTKIVTEELNAKL